MSYRIRRGRPIGEELERIAARLAEPPDAALDPEKRVHEFRKNTKKLRAIARLLGGLLVSSVFTLALTPALFQVTLRTKRALFG